MCRNLIDGYTGPLNEGCDMIAEGGVCLADCSKFGERCPLRSCFLTDPGVTRGYVLKPKEQ